MQRRCITIPDWDYDFDEKCRKLLGLSDLGLMSIDKIKRELSRRNIYIECAGVKLKAHSFIPRMISPNRFDQYLNLNWGILVGVNYIGVNAYGIVDVEKPNTPPKKHQMVIIGKEGTNYICANTDLSLNVERQYQGESLLPVSMARECNMASTGIMSAFTLNI
jgi:hypothetical protein